MAHFAKLDDNNFVIDVNVVNNEDIDNLEFPESEPIGIDFLTSWSGGYSNWKQTSYNKNFRKNYAGIGFKYDPIRDAFIPPKQHASWVFDEDLCMWVPPTPQPNDGKYYVWDEISISWKELT